MAGRICFICGGELGENECVAVHVPTGVAAHLGCATKAATPRDPRFKSDTRDYFEVKA
jgi:hypothetical protein